MTSRSLPAPQRAVTLQRLGHAALDLFQFAFVTIGTAAVIIGAVILAVLRHPIGAPVRRRSGIDLVEFESASSYIGHHLGFAMGSASSD
jgi:hypothetical protein